MTAAALLRELTGREPDGVWSAPGRVNLIGEHTDYNDGFVLPFATPHRTVAALATRADGRIRVASTFDVAPVEVALTDLDALFPARRDEIPEWARYPLGVAWALLFAAGVDPQSVPGVDIAFASEVPVGAGLSSSAAIECATAVALTDTWGLDLDRVALARAGRTAENEAVGAPTGIMDQMASMFGRADAATFLDCRSLEAESIDLGFAAAGLEVLVIDTRVKHAHSTGGYGERRAACERGAAAMGVPALRDLGVDDLDRVAALVDDVTFRRRAIGELLDASHASMRDDFEISVPELDLAVDAARAAGAIGARMTGGGFGGAAIALVDRDAAASVAASVTAAFADAGFREPHVFAVRAGEGARRDD